MTEHELTKKLEVIKLWAEHLIANSRPPESPAGESAYYCAKAFLETELKGILNLLDAVQDYVEDNNLEK